MENRIQDWDDLGRNIQDIVDRAVNSHDFQKMDQTIRQAIEKAVDIGTEAVRKAVDNTTRPAQAHPEYRTTTLDKPAVSLYGSTGRATAGGILKIIAGGILSVFTFLILLSVVFLEMLADMGRIAVPMYISLAGMTAGIGLMFSGIGNLKLVSRFKAYRKVLGQKTQCSLEKLARSVGKSEKFVRKEIRRMITKGFFLQGHMDKEETCLITSHATYDLFEQSRLQLEERKRLELQQKQNDIREKAASNTLSAEVQEVLNRGDNYISQIRTCNEAIPGHAISEKISRIELLVERIFDRAEAHPEVIPDLKKMMDYYLPMTVKLLNAYAEMDSQPIQGETIQSSKQEIESTLDTLNRAFEKLLDELFADTALDISSDISVLNTLLAQEGLTDDDFSKIKNQPM